MIKKVKYWLVIVFLLLSISLLAWFKWTQPRILIIHSYHQEYPWTRDIDSALRRKLESNLHVKVQWHFMDIKRHPNEDFKRRAGILARHQIEVFRPDVVIGVDDDAHKYVGKFYVNHPKIKVLFAGINGSVAPYGYLNANNVTGIFERKPLLSLRDALLSLRKKDEQKLGLRLAFLGDTSDSVMDDSKEIQATDWAPFKKESLTLALTFDDWKQAVLTANETADVLILANHHNVFKNKDKKETVPLPEVMKWTEENSKIPVVGMGNYMVEGGGMFAVGSSGFEQGEVVANMVLDMIEQNKDIKTIPYVMPRQYLVYMRQSLLDKRELQLPNIYEAFSRASNNYYP